jgi:hypothetical protein
MSDWISVALQLPEIGQLVDTKIDDGNGVRNEQPLKRVNSGRLWFFPDGSMYVYYTPTHWRKRAPDYLAIGAEVIDKFALRNLS